MASGYEFRLIQRLTEAAASHGMQVVLSRHGHETLSLIPFDECLPIYSRDAELASGSAEHLESVLQGWDKARLYYSMLGLPVTDSKIRAAEEKYNQSRTAHKLKTGENLKTIDK